jgi:predicted nucleotidyltransferase
MNLAISLPQQFIEEFCDRWQIDELSLFGSILRNDFHPESDIDLLVTFAPNADWSLLDHAKMQQELVETLGREVDLITKRAIERSSNWIRRQEILSTAQTIYAKQSR